MNTLWGHDGCETLIWGSKASIPYYVAQSEWFVALCPTLPDARDGSTLDQHTWATRGWCRCEKMVKEISSLQASQPGLILLVEGPKHLTLLPTWESFLTSPGHGHFTFPKDLKVVTELLQDMLQVKLGELLAAGDLPNYRFLLNQQHVRFRDCPIKLLSLGSDGCLEAFMEENRFNAVRDRDAAGWSPLCYAAIKGDPRVVEALLEKGARPDDCIRKGMAAAFMPSGLPAVSLCAYFGNNEAMQVLLGARASPVQRDWRFGTPLFWANLSDNVEGTRMLLRAGADALAEGNPSYGIRLNPPWNVLENACAVGAVKVLEELMPAFKDRCHYGLHNAFLIKGGSPKLIKSMLRHGVDVDEQFDEKKTMWLLHCMLFAKHFLSSSALTRLFYHRPKATPLMMAILSASFAAAECLLQAGARVDLRNARKRTAFDFAIQKLRFIMFSVSLHL